MQLSKIICCCDSLLNGNLVRKNQLIPNSMLKSWKVIVLTFLVCTHMLMTINIWSNPKDFLKAYSYKKRSLHPLCMSYVVISMLGNMFRMSCVQNLPMFTFLRIYASKSHLSRRGKGTNPLFNPRTDLLMSLHSHGAVYFVISAKDQSWQNLFLLVTSCLGKQLWYAQCHGHLLCSSCYWRNKFYYEIIESQIA